MKKATFNNLINLEYPDDFNQLSDQENEQYFTGDLVRLSFHSKEKHILLSLSKSKNSFMHLFISPATAVNGALSNLENTLKEFQYIEEFETTIFGRPAMTACFSYMANDQDIKQYGELSAFKVKRTFYVIYSVCRFENKEENKKIFKQFKDSFTSSNI